MASCKDCLHFEVCKNHYNICQAHNLNLYKDRTRFVELPCKVGDIIYEICERRKNGEWKKVIVERVVHGIKIGINGYVSARCGTSITVFLSELGKTVFLTREEAEKALEERDKNAL